MNEQTSHFLTELQKAEDDSTEKRIRLQKFIEAGNADFSGATFSHLDLTGIVFRSVLMLQTQFIDCKMDQCRFEHCSMDGLKMSNGVGQSATFRDGEVRNCVALGMIPAPNCEGTKFEASMLQGAKFGDCKLSGVVFEKCELDIADFVGARVDESTKFKNLRGVKNATIDRYSLACLGDNSGLTLGNKMDLKIVDDAAKLREEFGGIWALLHLAALIIFLFPYAKFLLVQSTRARFADADANDIPLLEALLRFVWNGGRDWQKGWDIAWLSFIAFILFLTYNIARGVLLWKTKKLETQQEVSGLPVRFSLDGDVSFQLLKTFTFPWWRFCYGAVNFLFYVAGIAVVINTWHFLMQTVPIDG